RFALGLGCKSKARQRRYDDIEFCREGADDLLKLDHGAGPAVSEQDGERARGTAADVVEVHIVVAHARQELRIAVERGFGFAPVETGRPVLSELLEIVEIGAV